jgi:Uncharacterized protein conserved in bacteria (DUF2213)
MTELRFYTNKTASQARRHKHTDGKEYLIVPTVAIVDGVVMNGLLYTADEMARYIEVWNGKPLTIGHPADSAGNAISANSPDQHARSIGFFYNAKFEGGKLKGEWWIDIERCAKLGGDAQAVVNALEAGKTLEQSTGLFTDVEETTGVSGGREYFGIARNIRPDHVAILLHETGACSIADGCGSPRTNSQEGEVMDRFVYTINLKLSLDEQLNQVYEAFYNRFERPDGEMMMRPRQVYESSVIAANDEGLWSYPYSRNDDGIDFGEPVKVEVMYTEVETGKPVNNNLFRNFFSGLTDQLKSLIHKEQGMNEQQQLVSKLVTNAKCPLGEKSLEALSLDELKKLDAAIATNDDQQGNESAEDAPAQPAQPTPAQLPESITRFAAILDKVGVDKFEAALTNITANADRERADLVAQITTNSDMTEDDLKGLEVAQLRKFAKVAVPQQNTYFRPGVIVNHHDDSAEWQEYTLPQPVTNGAGNGGNN